MKFDILLTGLGGQGIRSISSIIEASASRDGLDVSSSARAAGFEREGAIRIGLRLQSKPVAEEDGPGQAADLIIGTEPLESLKCAGDLASSGTLLSSTDAVLDIPDYPELGRILDSIREVRGARLVEAHQLARHAGSPLVAALVLVGAASRLLPIKEATLERTIRERLSRDGDGEMEAGLRAFQAGREAVARE
jgi:Pyruvate/2-oxoacid:ferredoxin oxidoreductase gamma subunit